jgi:hypothetical protein
MARPPAALPRPLEACWCVGAAVLDSREKLWHIRSRIKSRADALANLPSRARWFPQGDVATSATKRVA